MTLARALLSQRVGDGADPDDENLDPSEASASCQPEAGRGEPLLPEQVRRQDGPLEEKRVRNVRIKADLGVRLLFPSYREGLSAISRGDVRPFTPEDLNSTDTLWGSKIARPETMS